MTQPGTGRLHHFAPVLFSPASISTPLSYTKMVKFALSSDLFAQLKIHQNAFVVGAPPRIPLGEFAQTPRRLGRKHLSHSPHLRHRRLRCINFRRFWRPSSRRLITLSRYSSLKVCTCIWNCFLSGATSLYWSCSHLLGLTVSLILGLWFRVFHCSYYYPSFYVYFILYFHTK